MSSSDVHIVKKTDLYIDSCGCQLLAKDPDQLNTFSWSDYHILYVTEGSGYAVFGEKRLQMTEGTLLIFLPWQIRNYGFHRNKESRSYYLHFNGSACEELMNELGLSEGNYFYIGTSHSLTKQLDSLVEEFQQKREHYEYMCHSHMLAILTMISRKLSGTPQESSEAQKRINEICRYIYENCHKIESVGELAKMTHLSESRFTHLFSEAVGISPKAYILAARVDIAKELLTDTNRSVGSISESMGFSDQNYFSRVFKRLTDMSPTEYRRIFTESH